MSPIILSTNPETFSVLFEERRPVNSSSAVSPSRGERNEVKEMKKRGFYEPKPNSIRGCAEHITLAERELSAFFRAVSELFGAKQAELSAEDWLHEFTAIGSLPASKRELRWITSKASTRLASRVNALSLFTELQSL
jgi:hypothetical protein